MAKRSRPSRLRVPEVLSGPYAGLLIGTYGAQLDFAEREIFRSLAKPTLNRIILADARQLASHFETATDLRKANRTYVAAPVTSPHAHHPKYILLVGPERGTLLVGSGNLSVSGYTGPGECFATYQWGPDEVDDLDAFAAVRHLTDRLRQLDWIDAVVENRLSDLWSTAPWIPAAPSNAAPVRHNLDQPLLDQLHEVLDGRAMEELVVAAPFHDRGARALQEVLDRLKPKRLTLLVQQRQTRLDKKALVRVLSKRRGKVAIFDAQAPAPYPATWLHAKFLLARTGSGDVLLQGSPNLSTVALVALGASANVEVANLLEGASGSFDGLLDALDRHEIDLDSFVPESWDEADDNENETQPIVDTVTWDPPRLEGRLAIALEPTAAISVVLDDRVLVPKRVSTEVRDSFTVFTLEFSDDDCARIEGSAGLKVVVGDVTTTTIYPYFVQDLVRLTSAGYRVDLLREAGTLDLDDRELEELLAELDRVLIVDGRSVWRLAHPETEGPAGEDEEGPHIAYEELDWETINARATIKQYKAVSQRAVLAPTELGIVLQALTDRFRAEVRQALGESADDDSAADDLGYEPAAETEEEADGDGDGDSEQVRRQSARTRARRLWRNFVRRFVRGVSDSAFVQSVGSSVIVPSYIVFNHLCRRLRVVDLIDPDFLTESQLHLWTFMWGAGTEHPGYLASLSAAERDLALELLVSHEDLPATIAALDDVWWHLDQTDLDEDALKLRDFWRSLLCNDAIQLDHDAMTRAALVASNLAGDEKMLVQDLVELAEVMALDERDSEVAGCLGVSSEVLRENRATVRRQGVNSDESYLEVADPAFVLSAENAAEAIACWSHYEPERTYFRLKASNAVVIVDTLAGSREFFSLADNSESALEERARPAEPWRERLREIEAA